MADPSAPLGEPVLLSNPPAEERREAMLVEDEKNDDERKVEPVAAKSPERTEPPVAAAAPKPGANLPMVPPSNGPIPPPWKVKSAESQGELPKPPGLAAPLFSPPPTTILSPPPKTGLPANPPFAQSKASFGPAAGVPEPPKFTIPAKSGAESPTKPAVSPLPPQHPDMAKSAVLQLPPQNPESAASKPSFTPPPFAQVQRPQFGPPSFQVPAKVGLPLQESSAESTKQSPWVGASSPMRASLQPSVQPPSEERKQSTARPSAEVPAKPPARAEAPVALPQLLETIRTKLALTLDGQNWACPACTLHNELRYVQCAVCLFEHKTLKKVLDAVEVSYEMREPGTAERMLAAASKLKFW